jgi:hypothetical protein
MAPAVRAELDLHNRHTMGGQGLLHLLEGHRQLAVGGEEDRVDVLVVEHEQPAPAPGLRAPEREVVHAVVVRAHLEL